VVQPPVLLKEHEVAALQATEQESPALPAPQATSTTTPPLENDPVDIVNRATMTQKRKSQ